MAVWIVVVLRGLLWCVWLLVDASQWNSTGKEIGFFERIKANKRLLAKIASLLAKEEINSKHSLNFLINVTGTRTLSPFIELSAIDLSKINSPSL